MNHERELGPFACVEAGCEGIVDPLSEKVIRLNPDDYSTKHAVPCADCGRLYAEDNLPVLSDDYMKVFIIPGGVAHRPLTAVEKYNLVRDSLGMIEGGSSFEAQGTYRRRVIALCGGEDVFFSPRKSRQAHAEDCESKKYGAVHMCNCGVLYARDWFKTKDNLAGELS